MEDNRDFLSPVIELSSDPKSWKPKSIGGGFTLVTDTINRRSWRSGTLVPDVAVVYPIDAMDYDEGDACVHNLIRRGIKKIFLVSWTDNKDFGWIDQFEPVHSVYDAEEEDPEYHERVMEHVSSVSTQTITKKLPDYAKSVNDRFLIFSQCY
ncbi:MAG: hypothetical protein ACTSP4_11995 [Candidatus Hodarchaeales archaeon]